MVIEIEKPKIKEREIKSATEYYVECPICSYEGKGHSPEIARRNFNLHMRMARGHDPMIQID